MFNRCGLLYVMIENKKKKDMISNLREAGYRSDPIKSWKASLAVNEEEERGSEGEGEESEPEEQKSDDYNYLLSMSLWSLTREKKEELLKNRDEKVERGIGREGRGRGVNMEEVVYGGGGERCDHGGSCVWGRGERCDHGGSCVWGRGERCDHGGSCVWGRGERCEHGGSCVWGRGERCDHGGSCVWGRGGRCDHGGSCVWGTGGEV